jgi:hypothetical protein
MSHPKEPRGATTRESTEDPWTNSVAARDWDTDTDVMPPEYCRQLLEISRQLQNGK